MPGYAVIDFETTGRWAEHHDRVVEVGVVLTDGDGHPEETWSTLVNPQRDVGASEIHGIRAGDVLDAPLFSDITDELIARLYGRTIVAHNASFDMRFLHAELLRSGYEMPDVPAALCSMKWSRAVLGVQKLPHCCEALGIELTDAHSALGDALATSSLLVELRKLAHYHPHWQLDHERSLANPWPRTLGRPAPRLVARSDSRAEAPDAWLSQVVHDAALTGSSDGESEYLDELEKCLLDSHISKSEGRLLVELAHRYGISRARLDALHRQYLQAIATEALSDDLLEDWELARLRSVATSLALTDSDVAAALESAQSAPRASHEVFLHEGDRVVFTGALTEERSVWIERIRRVGLETGGITKKTRVVVAADPDSLSGKAKKARDYGVPLVNEEAFRRLFQEYVETRS